ncbi:cytochrome c biogenesis protein ResB [Aromatoleum toluvorans]|uniref:cytochrome c biogenesis protein ResB n=1 Tax=Aromatoleum toluvorans TaxID=92002 RepID=UPI001FEBEE36|nr:cytochrome c biogenesis protein ResB [Aromatoleum toluvorans]
MDGAVKRNGLAQAASGQARTDSGDPTERSSAGVGLVRRLASLRLTLALIVLLGVGVAFAYLREGARTWPLVVPLILLAINLMAAVMTNGVFRRQTALLVFHLALVVLLLLVAAGRLTYLNGYVGVTEDVPFEGELSESDRGPLHAGALSGVRFVNRGFHIDYAPGLQREATRNQVAWQGSDGRWHDELIGDQKPLVVSGYRFYTTFNKGFAPTFRWRDTHGYVVRGSVQLPPYPLKEYSQAAEWSPPGSTLSIWVLLDIDEIILDPAEHTSFRLPEHYKLVVRIGRERHEMHPGDSLQTADGTLEFEGLRNWMGYRVFYDWTLPWLLAACAVAVVSLAAHFWRKFTARPWDA